MQFSLVIPVYNELPSLAQLHAEIQATARTHGYEFQILFIDDGSTDGSWQEIQRLAQSDPSIAAVRFRANFGKSAALAAGLDRASFDWVVTIDSDLQDNIAELPKLVEVRDGGADLVCGWKKIRRDPIGKRVPSKIFNALVNRLSGLQIHDHNCGFKLFRRELLRDSTLFGDWHRFIPFLASNSGWSVAEVAVDHRRRKHGKSKYGWGRFWTGTFDLMTMRFLTSRHSKPQHALGTLGMFAGGIGGAGLIYLAVYWWLRVNWYRDWTPVHERPLLLYSLGALLVGVNLLAIGFIAALIVAYRTSDRPTYSVADEIVRDHNKRSDRNDSANA